MNSSTVQADFLVRHTRLLMQSYARLFVAPLIDHVADDANVAALLHAPFVVVSHNVAVDPVFNYANHKALALFEFSWDEFTCLPSRLSAEPINQQDREALLASVRERGFIPNYQGIRRSKTGRRFQINNAVVWNLYDQDDVYCGQAACIKEWVFLPN
ncbi:MAG: MEKHLA domain-containing protein [Methylococcaceae bacterium]|nr:MEKHLA domain-containing protein [Methylococcaceae bacterium]